VERIERGAVRLHRAGRAAACKDYAVTEDPNTGVKDREQRRTIGDLRLTTAASDDRPGDKPELRLEVRRSGFRRGDGG
jgi:hypothetical protein